jgi:small-conductance mechanosensitive channel/CRP-like cAMP-binding protein
VNLYPLQVAAVAALLVAAVAVRATARNRHVRRRQRLTILLCAAWFLTELVLEAAGAAPEAAEQARALAHVGLALAAINFVIVVGVNPLRHDRAPERFPVILQDAVIVGVFALAATAILRERVLALSAVGAVVIGFALQDTLGNAFAGLAIQTEKPFDVGHWIRVSEHEGQVTEITWRATKLRTRDDSFLIVPNNVMSRELVLNYSEPVLPTRVWVEIGAPYEKPPAEVKKAILEAIGNAPLALSTPSPDVLLWEFAGSSITYRARFWVADYGLYDIAQDQVRTDLWYAFRRRGIEIPFPIQVEYSREDTPPAPPTDRFVETLRGVEVFASLDEAERLELAQASTERLYAAGETVVRQGTPGSSMFVVCEGELEVVIGPDDERIATIGPQGFLGEMSLLAGAPRSATVRTLTEALLMEIAAENFRRFVLERPAVLERITERAVARREALEHSRQAGSRTAGEPRERASVLSLVRRFLRLDA